MYMRELEVITDALRRAGRMALGGDRAARSKQNACGIYDIVTDSDIRAEEIIVSAIREAFPDDIIISEELNPDTEACGRTWAIDPIDGTMNYSRGIPLFGLQAVFMDGCEPKASAIYLPVYDEMYTASSEGAFLNGVPLRTAEPRPLRQCIVSTGDFSKKCHEFRQAQAVIFHDCYRDVARFKVFGASCIDFTFLSSARTDVHVRFVNKIWDYLPGLFLAEMAGAVYDKQLMRDTSILILCSSQEVLEEATGSILPRIMPCFRRS